MGIAPRSGNSVGLWVGLLIAAGPSRTPWKLGEHTWVKRVPAEAGAPLNEPPARIDRVALHQRPGKVRFLADRQGCPCSTRTSCPRWWTRCGEPFRSRIPVKISCCSALQGGRSVPEQRRWHHGPPSRAEWSASDPGPRRPFGSHGPLPRQPGSARIPLRCSQRGQWDHPETFHGSCPRGPAPSRGMPPSLRNRRSGCGP